MRAVLNLSNLKLTRFKKRRFIIIAGLVVLALLSVIFTATRPLEAEVFTVETRDFSKGFTEEGTVIAAKEWPVFNPFEGKIQALKVKNGDHVGQGQVLLEMNTADLYFQLQALKVQSESLEGQRILSAGNTYEAQAAQQNLVIRQAEKDLATQELNLTRMKALYDTGSISLVDYDTAQDAVGKMQNFLAQQKEALNLIKQQQQSSREVAASYVNQKKAMQAQIAQLEAKIGKAVVVALQDGIIKDLTLKEGNVIPQGQQIMTLFSDGGYKLESYILAGDALDIKAGSPVQIIQKVSSGNISFPGEVETVDITAVERISPLGLKENRVKVTVLFTASSPVVLGSELDIQYTTSKVPAKLLIPKTALFSWQQEDAVWVVQQGKAKIQPVKKGLENDSEVIIEEGLSAGDIILQDTNLTKLTEGKRITALPNQSRI
jgi:RND family efflux transporter, MFP subunit